MKIDSESRIVDSVIDQLQYCKKISKIVVATTDLDDDAKLFEHVKNQNIECFRGSSENVLDRYFQCATKYGFDVIVRITADNPFIDPVIVDDLIGLFQSSNYDYGSNTNPRSFPQGTEVEIFTYAALSKAKESAAKRSEQEHVTPFFYNNPDIFKICNLSNSNNLSKLRWTVDTSNDLDFVREISKRISSKPVLMKDILTVLKNESSLMSINGDRITNEGGLKSLREELQK